MFSCLRSFRVTNCRHAMPLVRGLGSSSFCTSQPKIYSDLFLKIQDEHEVNTIKKHAPVYDRKNKYEPQFYEVVEQFLDAFARKPPPGRPPLRGWNCLTDQGETFHWKDTVDKNGVTRVKIQSEGDLQRHIEIHWDHHFILTYQHDPNESYNCLTSNGGSRFVQHPDSDKFSENHKLFQRTTDNCFLPRRVYVLVF